MVFPGLHPEFLIPPLLEIKCLQVFIVNKVVVNISVHKTFSKFNIIISGYVSRSKIPGSKGQ